MAQMNAAKSAELDAQNLRTMATLKARGFSVEFSIQNRRNLFQLSAIATSRQDFRAVYFASFSSRQDAQAYTNMLSSA